MSPLRKQAFGATLIAVSPEKVPLLGKTAEKTGVAFTLLHDENCEIAQAFDVAFKPDSVQRVMYNTMLNAKLKEAHSDDSHPAYISCLMSSLVENVVIFPDAPDEFIHINLMFY
ncbi:MAG: peroxiredoxin family protein [Bacteroidales bacterium]